MYVSLQVYALVVDPALSGSTELGSMNV